MELIAFKGSENSIIGEIKVAPDIVQQELYVIAYITPYGDQGCIGTPNVSHAYKLVNQLLNQRNKVEMYRTKDGEFVKKVVG